MQNTHRVNKRGCRHLSICTSPSGSGRPPGRGPQKMNTLRLIHIPKAFTQRGILFVNKTHSTNNLATHLQVCETGMTHRAQFSFLFQYLKYSQMEYYVHWHLHGRCTKQSIQVFHNYRITFVTMWMFTPRVYLEKHHFKKKHRKTTWMFHWINFHKKWIAKNIRTDA